MRRRTHDALVDWAIVALIVTAATAVMVAALTARLTL
jgi:hypothetical protein